jgi:hypothetical protein
MAAFLKIINKDVRNWETKINAVSEYAEDLRPIKRLKIFQDIFDLEKELSKLKFSLKMLKCFPKDEYDLQKHKVIKTHKALGIKMKLSQVIEQVKDTKNKETNQSWEAIQQVIRTNEDNLKTGFNNKKALKKTVGEVLTEISRGIKECGKWFKRNKKQLSPETKFKCQQGINELKYYQLHASSQFYKLINCSKKHWNIFRTEFVKAFTDLSNAWARHCDVFKKIKRGKQV